MLATSTSWITGRRVYRLFYLFRGELRFHDMVDVAGSNVVLGVTQNLRLVKTYAPSGVAQ